MSMLTGPEILAQVTKGTITIEPFDEKYLNPNSYNLRLLDKLLVYRKMRPIHDAWDTAYRRAQNEGHMQWAEWPKLPFPEPLDMAVEEKTTNLTIPPEGIVLWPGVLYLGATVEYTDTRVHVPKIDGRSSVGRLGMCIHVTAGFGDVGFRGDWTLEVVVPYPLKVYAGTPVCQIAYTEPTGEILEYAGQYQGQRGPKPSGLWRSFTHDDRAKPANHDPDGAR